MGLIKAIGGSIGGVLADQWKEYYYCDSMSADVLACKGRKRTSGRSSNTKGEDNIITNGSVLAVNEGQCAIIVDQGKVVEVCSEAGEYKYDSSTEPSLFTGNLGTAILNTFKTIGKRFTFGGDTAKDQRIYYFNTKEIVGNKYGTANPVPFRVVDNNIGLDMDIAIRCHGEYSYRITDPILFYTNVCGNVTERYVRTNIDSMLRTELMTALQPAFAKISETGIRYSALPGHTVEIADALNEVLSKKWREKRGIEVASFGVNSVSASEEDERTIKELQRAAVLSNPAMAAGTIAGAQAQAMQDAAKNQNAGPMMAFAGMNMAANAGGLNAGALFQMAGQRTQNRVAAQSHSGWNCSCGKMNTGKFCSECGQPQPKDTEGWTCVCGVINKGRFCTECGSPKPAGAKTYRCDKCGWEPADKNHPPKFCPECGDIFNDDDVVR
ncbi:MAG: SPFH domain-containing protein [Clostridia bacterium]|nr:SPFH domain-containing protein [Clostridia bacterium]